MFFCFFSSRRRHTRCALVTGVQTCALPIFDPDLQHLGPARQAHFDSDSAFTAAEATIDRQLLHQIRSEEHTSELQSLMRISYAVFCLKKKKIIHKKLPYTNCP